MFVICGKCKKEIDIDEHDFCPECGAPLKNAIAPKNKKELMTYTALKNQYESDKKELFIYLAILGGVLLFAVLWFVLEKALY